MSLFPRYSVLLSLSLSLWFCLRHRRGNLGSPWHRRYLLTPTRPRDRTYRPHSRSTLLLALCRRHSYYYYYYYHRNTTTIAGAVAVSPIPPLELCHHYVCRVCEDDYDESRAAYPLHPDFLMRLRHPSTCCCRRRRNVSTRTRTIRTLPSQNGKERTILFEGTLLSHPAILIA